MTNLVCILAFISFFVSVILIIATSYKHAKAIKQARIQKEKWFEMTNNAAQLAENYNRIFEQFQKWAEDEYTKNGGNRDLLDELRKYSKQAGNSELKPS